MLDFLGNGDERYRAAHDGILQAIERVIAEGRSRRIWAEGFDAGGGKAIAERL
ncbi:hypothetical protein QNM99_10415 [Pseudomonas sp. PCH446]